jgi:hypothetical protein
MHTKALSKGITLAELLVLSEILSSPNFDHPVSDSPDQWDTTISNPQTVTVDTQFNPKDPRNHTPLKDLSEQECQEETDKHRSFTSNATKPTDLADLVNTVSFQCSLPPGSLKRI